MVHIILVRHAQSMANLEGRWSGATEEELSPLGYEQTVMLTEHLRSVKIDRIYSSPMKRTRETIFPVALSHGLEPIICDDLREANYGVFDGLTDEEMQRKYPDLYPIRKEYLNRNIIPGQEPYIEVQKRVVACITKIARENDGKTILISSHYDAIRSFLCFILNIPFRDFPKYVNLYNIAINEVMFDPRNNTFKIIQLSH